MSLRFCIDRLDHEIAAGWIDHDNHPARSVSIEVNGQLVCSLSPTKFREDLRDAGYGDGRRAFAFELSGYLPPGPNLVVVRVADDVIAERTIFSSAASPQAAPERERALAEYSRRRWRGDEPSQHLTWGRMMTADSLWNIYQRFRTFTLTDRILEIGPGYGRLLKTAIKRRVPFAHYLGVELSAERVTRLSEEFSNPSIEFVVGDVENWRGQHPLDVILCSSTFEHLYPDCRAALVNLRSQTAKEASLFIDFIRSDQSRGGFDPGSAYVREYDKTELRQLFAECGYTPQAIEDCVLGDGQHGPVNRYVVVARPR